jgi:hypothetical protein
MLPATQSLSNALNALLPPALCQCLITLDSQQEASPDLMAQWALAQRQLEAGMVLLRGACQDPALAAQAGRLVQLHAGFSAAAQILERHLRTQRA